MLMKEYEDTIIIILLVFIGFRRKLRVTRETILEREENLLLQ
jgi:hypothetical protein